MRNYLSYLSTFFHWCSFFFSFFYPFLVLPFYHILSLFLQTVHVSLYCLALSSSLQDLTFNETTRLSEEEVPPGDQPRESTNEHQLHLLLRQVFEKPVAEEEIYTPGRQAQAEGGPIWDPPIRTVLTNRV